MLLDIGTAFGDIQPDPAGFRRQLQAIAKLTRQSSDLHKWSNNLRFITSHPDVWRDTPETRKEKILTTHIGSTFTDNPGKDYPATTINPRTSQPCSCNKWSRRPVDPKASKLWVTHRDDAPRCPHFVAVSYCWPQPSEGESSPAGAYSLNSNEGTKKSDAPDEVIERSLKFANYVELSAVWIDQQCIDQNDREDKECGIQSMDLVYENAQVSLGLLSIVAREQKQVDLLEPGRLLRDLQASTKEDPKITNDDLWSFLRWIDAERWFTRAWCMQESWSAGPRMVLMINCDSTLDKPESLGSIAGEALVSFQALSTLLGVVIEHIKPREENADAIELDALWLDRLKRKVVKVLPKHSSSMVIGGRHRLRCSAAEGLHSLAVRENSRIVDRIAILGNLCNFDVRLDTERLESDNYTFSTAAFALASLNGDLSLMSCLPASHQPSKRDAISQDPDTFASAQAGIAAPHLGFSWGPPLSGTLTNLEWVSEDSNPKRLAQCELTEEGLSTFGWVFLCDLFIDVSPLQITYKEEWEKSRSSSESTGNSKICIRIIWSLIRLLIHKGYLHLAQVVWSHEHDLQIPGTEELFKIPMDIRELINPETHGFIFRATSVQSEHQFLDSLLPAEEAVFEVPSYSRTWLAETVMTKGKVLCGRQVNTGISLPPAHAMMSFSTEHGKLDIKPGFDPRGGTPPTNEPKIEDRVPGTDVPKSKYTSMLQSEAANMKCVFTPALQHRLEGRSPHTWRPQHWIANRTFKGSAGDLWKVEGGQLIRGYVVPTTMFSRCVLV